VKGTVTESPRRVSVPDGLRPGAAGVAMSGAPGTADPDRAGRFAQR